MVSQVAYNRSAPDWRDHSARLRAGQPSREPGRLHAPTRGAARCYRMRAAGAAGERRARELYPHACTGQDLPDAAARRKRLQPMGLGGPPAAEAVERMTVAPEVVLSRQELFFDVRRMLPSAAWIASQVIKREAGRGEDGLAIQLRLVFSGGSADTRALLDASVNVPAGKVQQRFDASLLLQVTIQQALSLPVEPAGRETKPRIWAEITVDGRRTALDCEKLSARMTRWSEHLPVARKRNTILRQLATAGLASPWLLAAE